MIEAQEQGEAKANNSFMDSPTFLLIAQGLFGFDITIANLVIFRNFAMKLHGKPRKQQQFANATSGIDSFSLPESPKQGSGYF